VITFRPSVASACQQNWMLIVVPQAHSVLSVSLVSLAEAWPHSAVSEPAVMHGGKQHTFIKSVECSAKHMSETE
jgi:hypothetical protein